MSWCVPRIWEGGDVWIIGGGPSVTEQFDIPEPVVRAVKAGVSPPEIYSQYMRVLHDKHVIGINVAYLIGSWIDICFFGDNKFYLRHKERLAQWPGIKVSCFKGISDVSWIKYVPRDGARRSGISTNPGTVAWNLNSGAAAISIAANAGAKRIYLLGFDMKVKEGDQHWHKLYRVNGAPPPRRGGLPPARHMPFDRHLRGFPQIARDAKMLGIEIINVCPDSAITVFPKVTLKDVLK